MARILITPVKNEFVTLDPFELQGSLKIIDHGDLGVYYYMSGQSFPAKVVTVLEEAEETA